MRAYKLAHAARDMVSTEYPSLVALLDGGRVAYTDPSRTLMDPRNTAKNAVRKHNRVWMFSLTVQDGVV